MAKRLANVPVARLASGWGQPILLVLMIAVPVGAAGGLEDSDARLSVPSGVEAAELLARSQVSGGLIVLAAGQDAERIAALAEPFLGEATGESETLVQALAPDRETLEAVRGRFRQRGLYGRFSALRWQPPALPYAGGTVNLLLVDARVEPSEVQRVLAPRGVAWRRAGERWEGYRQPVPAGFDEWRHARYDATGNAVSGDGGAGPPRSVQWEAWPRWNRGVKTSSMVSAGGRVFYILDDSHFGAGPRSWSLIARDAFNGVQLWRHELADWPGARGGKKVGPAQVDRRLVACDRRVFVAREAQAGICVLDAATGQVLRNLDPGGPVEEFVLANGVVIALVNPNTAAEVRRGQGRPLRLVALDPDGGDRLWEHASAMILPLTLAANGERVVFHDGEAVRSLALRTGVVQWTSPPTGQSVEFRDRANPDQPGAEPSTVLLAPQFAPTLILYEDVVAFAGGRQLNVLSQEDGRELWRSEYAASNYSVPVDLFGFDGYVWGPDAGMNLWRPLDDSLNFLAYDRHTGVVTRRVEGNYGYPFQHHRCHLMKVVDGTVLAARAGIEFLDTETGSVAAHHWVRGSCYYGVMPANGLLYVPPHDCACYVRAKLPGFFALRSELPAMSEGPSDVPRLEHGPAYGQTAGEVAGAGSDDWPTYRHDLSRSGRAGTRLEPELLLGWQTPLGAPLTSPVIAGGTVYVAATDGHTLYARDARTGEAIWEKTLEAHIDSPPTIYEGLVLLGCRDGSVHALRAADGARVWRFRAAPAERMIVVRGQLESAWPVHGSVLVVDDVVYFAAGRSSYLDGGIRLYGLDPHTGRQLVATVLDSRHEDGSQRLDDEGVDGCLNDILSSDGARLFLRHQALDLSGNPTAERIAHLHGADGYLSSDTTSRLQWAYAPRFTSPHQGAFYDQRLSRTLFPSGRILVRDGTTIFGYGQNHYARPRPEPGGEWALFAADTASDLPLDASAREYRRLALDGEHLMSFHWTEPIPIHVTGLVHAGEVLFAAGPLVQATRDPAEATGAEEARLLAIAPDSGQVLAEMSLPSPPVWDGMAAAGGGLYLALEDGRLWGLWPAASGRPGRSLQPKRPVILPPVELAAEPGLVGRWRFDEGIGTVARDASGQGHDARVTGRWIEDESGTCLAAGGVPRAAVIPDAEHLQFDNQDFSLALWVQVEEYGARLLGKEAFPENWWVVNLLDDGRLELVLGEGRGPGRSVRPTTATPLERHNWHHLVAVADRQAGEVRWYLDGRLDSRHAIPAAMTDGLHGAGRDIQIPSRHRPFHGRFADLRIYRRALSAERVQEISEVIRRPGR